jgi:PadR family transcriptional regulator, regulatory protein PadR
MDAGRSEAERSGPGHAPHVDSENAGRSNRCTDTGVRLEQISRGVFQVNAGSLFPALRRLERDGLIGGAWRVTENNRRAKYYSLTTAGRATLKRETRDWEAQTLAITRILKASLGEL